MGPIDTLFTITGLLFVLAAGYAFVMLPRGVTAPRSPERMARLDAQRSET
jgi:hypothetical protein